MGKKRFNLQGVWRRAMCAVAVLVVSVGVAASSTATASAATQYYIFDNLNSSMCLDMATRTSYGEPAMQQKICDRSWWQQWEVVLSTRRWVNGEYWYEIVNRATHHCLDVADSRPWDGAPVVAGYCDGGNSQRWALGMQWYGSYTLRALHSNKCLEVYGISKAYAASVVQWGCWLGPNQIWYNDGS